MKFAWKMIAVVAVLLALSLSVCGILVISGSFEAALNAEKETAQEELKLFSLTMQALCMEDLRRGDISGARRTLQDTPYSSDETLKNQFLVCTGKGEFLAGSRALHTYIQEDNLSDQMLLRIYEETDGCYLVAAQSVNLYGTRLSFIRCVSVEAAFERSRSELRRYELIMVIVLLIALALTMLLCFYMTEPIRRISRAAKQFSEGKYEKRAVVNSEDEVGHLAKSFNSMADSLESKIYELEDAAQRQKDFTASFAHELKTPLTSVIGYADTLRSCKLNRKQQLEAANFIFTEGKRLETMSFALLELFALEQKPPEFSRFPVAELVKEVENSCTYLLEEQKIRLTVKIRKYNLYGARELLKTLLYNLVDNARKASEPNSEILILGEPVENGYLLSVCDFGRGIPAESLARLTEPFYMVDKSRARAQGGAGLGLALCQKIVHLHGSTLQFESAPGKGTVVSFVLGGGGFET